MREQFFPLLGTRNPPALNGFQRISFHIGGTCVPGKFALYYYEMSHDSSGISYLADRGSRSKFASFPNSTMQLPGPSK